MPLSFSKILYFIMKQILFIKKTLIYFSLFIVAVLVIAVVGSLILKTIKTPKINADWELGQGQLARIDIAFGRVDIKNLRDFDWKKNEQKTLKNYINYSFDINEIIGMKVGVSHFSPLSDIAHVFIIFDLKKGKDISISVESRREKGEDFSLIKGLTYDYELIYVVATESDLINLRKVRNEKIYVYPIVSTAEKSRAIFKEMAKTINKIAKEPQFYHLFTRNCTNTITREVAKVSDIKFPFFVTTFLPGRTGEALFKMGIIDTKSKTFEELQKEFLVNFD